MKKFISWALVLLWMGVIFYLSDQPANVSDNLSGGITERVVMLLEGWMPFIADIDMHFIIRKGAHFSAYLLLALLLMNALRLQGNLNWKRAAIALVVAIGYAATDEFHQLFIPGRSGEVRDVLIDSVGAFFGILLVLLLQQNKRSRGSYGRKKRGK